MSNIRKNFALSTTNEDDNSDSLSTGAPSLSPHSNDGDDQMDTQSLDMGDTESISAQTKKIRKKRNAYQKIDDDIRLELLDAVQKRGETLKSAAKRLNINYSSAKSILHTFRKEGRILKKSALERTLKVCQYNPNDMEISPMTRIPFQMPEQYLMKDNNFSEAIRLLDLHQESTSGGFSDHSSPRNPMQELTNNFNHLWLNSQQRVEEPFAKTQIPSLPLQLKNKAMINDFSPHNSQNNQVCVHIPAFNPPQNKLPLGPREILKGLGFVMNYGDTTPLSGPGARARMYKGEMSDSSSRRRETEFGTFSELIESMQSLDNENDEKKKENIHIPKPMRFGLEQMMHDKNEPKLTREDSLDWAGTIENAAFDTFNTFMGAQLLLQDALQRASNLNAMVNFQKYPGFSPK